MTSFSDTIDYTKKQYMHSSYRWMKLTPVGGSGQSATLSTSSSTIVNFEIPNNVINLSQSKLAFDLLLTAAATTHCVDALSLSLFDRITLSTRSGVVLANCDNMGQFTHLITKLKTKSINLVDNPNNLTTTPQKANGGVSTPLTSYPIPTSLNTTVNISNKKPMSDICKSGACCFQSIGRSITTSLATIASTTQSLVNNVSNVYRIDGSVITTPFLENLHVLTENKVSSAAGTFAASYQLPLGSIKDTLLEINKSLYFGDNLILSLSFNPSTKFSWLTTGGVEGGQSTGTSASPGTTLSTGTAMVQWTPTAGAAVQSVPGALSNLALYVAVETDPIITSQLINKVNTEGFSMTVPYVYCTKTPVSIAIPAAADGIANTGSFSMQQRITRGYGQRLLRCYSSIFGAESIAAGNQCFIAGASAFLPKTVGDGTSIANATAVTAFTLNQHSDVTLGAYNTSLDGIRLQDFTLSAEDSTHWLVNEYYLRGSCILNVDQYKNQCMHIDSWTGNPVCEEDDTIDNGLSLDSDKTYGVSYTNLYNVTSQTSFQHYLFFVVQRQLTIKGNQIMLM